MIDPRKVDSPRDMWTLIDVLTEQGGEEGNRWWALALGKWDGGPCLAVRWNGAYDQDSKGNPQSRGYPTWFVLPDELAECAKTLVPEEKRALMDAILKDSDRSRF